MAPNYWPAAENLSALLDARAFEVAKGLDTTRLLREAESVMKPPVAELLFDYEGGVARLTAEASRIRTALDYQQDLQPAVTKAPSEDNCMNSRPLRSGLYEHNGPESRSPHSRNYFLTVPKLWGHFDHMSAVSSVAQLTPVEANWVGIRDHELHAHLSQATKFAENASAWVDIQQSIAGLAGRRHAMPWDDIQRLTATMTQEEFTMRHLSRLWDFDRVLSAVMPEPAHATWSSHLRMMALPSLSFLAQDWSKPLGLMTGLGSLESGMSVTWLTRHHAEPMVMTAAITPHGGRKKDAKIVVDDEVVCAVCRNPMTTVGTEFQWVGPRRGVRQRLIFPRCSTCAEAQREHPDLFEETLRRLTHPVMSLRIVAGGRQGDGRPCGVLRLVRADDRCDG